MITNTSSGTNLHEIAPGIYRINTPVEIPGGIGFNFNQYLVADDEPLLFHTGPRRLFPLTAEAIGKIVPLERLRYVAFSHYEADECGSLNDFLAAAPAAVPVCSQVAAMVSVDDVAVRPARALADGEVLRTRPPRLQVARHAARAARLGVRLHDGARDPHPVLRRPLHPGRRGRRGAHRGRHPRPERGLPRARWTTTRTPRRPARPSSASPASSPRSSPACTAAPGAATAPRSCAPSPAPSPAPLLCRPLRRLLWPPDKGAVSLLLARLQRQSSKLQNQEK